MDRIKEIAVKLKETETAITSIKSINGSIGSISFSGKLVVEIDGFIYRLMNFEEGLINIIVPIVFEEKGFPVFQRQEPVEELCSKTLIVTKQKKASEVISDNHENCLNLIVKDLPEKKEKIMELFKRYGIQWYEHNNIGNFAGTYKIFDFIANLAIKSHMSPVILVDAYGEEVYAYDGLRI